MKLSLTLLFTFVALLCAVHYSSGDSVANTNKNDLQERSENNIVNRKADEAVAANKDNELKEQDLTEDKLGETGSRANKRTKKGRKNRKQRKNGKNRKQRKNRKNRKQRKNRKNSKQQKTTKTTA